MGKSKKRELVHCLTALLAHLLKWQFQPGYRGVSWKLTVTEQRGQVKDGLDDNPSLCATLPETVVKAYYYAVLSGCERNRHRPRIFSRLLSLYN